MAKVIGPKEVAILILLAAGLSALGGWLIAKKESSRR